MRKLSAAIPKYVAEEQVKLKVGSTGKIQVPAERAVE